MNPNPLKRITKWRIQNSQLVSVSDAEVSQPSCPVADWHKAVTPATVLGTLTQNGVVKDPFVGENLKQIDKAPFRKPWWFRSEFELSASEAAQYAILYFDGINYRADIWLNGQPIANEKTVFGAFRRFRFDVSPRIHPGKNILAVKVFPPVPGDFSIGFVDWNPAPPDGNIGLFLVPPGISNPQRAGNHGKIPAESGDDLRG